jgi:hypothetical protein
VLFCEFLEELLSLREDHTPDISSVFPNRAIFSISLSLKNPKNKEKG